MGLDLCEYINCDKPRCLGSDFCTVHDVMVAEDERILELAIKAMLKEESEST